MKRVAPTTHQTGKSACSAAKNDSSPRTAPPSVRRAGNQAVQQLAHRNSETPAPPGARSKSAPEHRPQMQAARREIVAPENAGSRIDDATREWMPSHFGTEGDEKVECPALSRIVSKNIRDETGARTKS
jgi:hypothetical protein